MKKFRLTSIALFLMTSIFYFACEPQSDMPTPETSILPERFGIDIPNSLSSAYGTSNGRTAAIDTLKGNEIYQHLNVFINVGEGPGHAGRVFGVVLGRSRQAWSVG